MLPATAFKKNGTLHFKKSAGFYGVQPGTIRVWSRCGAPLLEPDRLQVWRDQRNRERWQKIAQKNNRHAAKEEQIVQLYVQEKLGLRSIAKYFSQRPSIAGVRKILVRRGVYRAGEALAEQRTRSLVRREAILVREQETRHRMAVCLWNLRRGIGIETTCRGRGWGHKNIWNTLRCRRSYKSFKMRQRRHWPSKRACSKYYSRLFVREKPFQDCVSQVLTAVGIEYVRECRLPNSRTYVDFKLSDGTFIECKVALNAAQVNEPIGQTLQYRAFAKKVVLCVPSDVQIRADLCTIIDELGVIMCNEQGVGELVIGKPFKLLTNQVVPQQIVRFICKCCGSTERRRHRINSYCVDCAPRIPNMTFDHKTNGWIRRGDLAANRPKCCDDAT